MKIKIMIPELAPIKPRKCAMPVHMYLPQHIKLQDLRQIPELINEDLI